MTTKAQVKKLMQPFLDRHPDLVLEHPWIYLKPVRHLIRSIILDRTSNANSFRPRWSTMMLFVPQSPEIDLAYGDMHSAHDGGIWRWDDPAMPEILFDLLEKKGLPALRRLEGVAEFVEYTSSTDRFLLNPLWAFPDRIVAADVALGNWESALAMCRKWVGVKEEWPGDPRSVVVNTLAPLLEAGDTTGAIEQLHEWESYSVKQLKLEKIWEPSPFPIEETA